MENNQNYKDERIIDLCDLFRELVNKILIIILVTVIGALLWIIIPKAIEEPQYKVNGTLIDVSGLAKEDIVKMIQSSAVAEETSLKISNTTGEEISVETIMNDIAVVYPDSSKIITISIVDNDPYVAFDIAKVIMDTACDYINSYLGTEAVSIMERDVIPSINQTVSIKKNAALGGIMGFIISFVVVVVMYITNKKIYSQEDIENYLDLRILGTIPLYSKKTFLQERADFDER